MEPGARDVTNPASRRLVQVVHDRSRCIFGVDRFTPLKQGLQDTYTWAAGPDMPDKLQSAQEFKAEILEQGLLTELNVQQLFGCSQHLCSDI